MISINFSHLRWKPTLGGLLCFFMLFILFITAVFYQNNLILFIACVYMAHILVFTYLSRRQFLLSRIQLKYPDILFSKTHDRILFTCVPHKRIRRFWSKHVIIDLYWQRQDSSSQQKKTLINEKYFFSQIESNQDKERTQYYQIPLCFMSRGVYKLQEIKISSSFPCSLWEWYYIGSADYLFYVGPQKIHHGIHQRKLLQGNLEKGGAEFSKERGDFFQHDHYRGGSLREIDWKVYAKTELLKTKKEMNDIHSMVLTLDSKNSHSWEDKLEDLTYWIDFYWKKKTNFTVKGSSFEVDFNFDKNDFLKNKYKNLMKVLSQL